LMHLLHKEAGWLTEVAPASLEAHLGGMVTWLRAHAGALGSVLPSSVLVPAAHDWAMAMRLVCTATTAVATTTDAAAAQLSTLLTEQLWPLLSDASLPEAALAAALDTFGQVVWLVGPPAVTTYAPHLCELLVQDAPPPGSLPHDPHTPGMRACAANGGLGRHLGTNLCGPTVQAVAMLALVRIAPLAPPHVLDVVKAWAARQTPAARARLPAPLVRVLARVASL
jgi:hypothetical protein